MGSVGRFETTAANRVRRLYAAGSVLLNGYIAKRCLSCTAVEIGVEISVKLTKPERHNSSERPAVSERSCELRGKRFKVEICRALSTESDIDWF